MQDRKKKYTDPSWVKDDRIYMPFGKYRGIRIEYIPADYLLWLDKQGTLDQSSPIANYINQSRRVLEREVKLSENITQPSVTK